jgi:flagellin
VATLDISVLTDLPDLRIEDYIKGVDDVRADDAGGHVPWRTEARIDLKEFCQVIIRSSGIGQLIDADMNAESTRLQALQVRQQLGVQALGIANQSASQILQLFQQG